MKIKYIYFLLIITLYGCDFGPSAKINDDFVSCNDLNKIVNLKDLIGNYKLDKDSKKRYGIPDSLDFYLELGVKNKKDTFLSLNRYINPIDRTIANEYLKDSIYFTNSYRTINTWNRNFLNGGLIDVYLNIKDSSFALYAYTPFVLATKENGMQYKEGDYLRYIKQ